MRKLLLSLVTVAVVFQATLLAIGTIKQVRLSEGAGDVNKISAPIFDAAPALNVAAFQPSYDRTARIVRRGATGMFTKGPEYNLESSVDLGATFGEALRSESVAMGFKISSGADAWQIAGVIKDVYLESKQIPYGATLFYGFLDVELAAHKGRADAQTRRMRFHNYYGGYNAGMGRKDEAESALAQLLLEGAQEALSRLNRDLFKAPVHAGITAKIAALSSGANKNTLHLVGLSGAPSAVPPLLGLLAKEPDEHARSAIIDAIARLGSPDAVAPLAARYATEDEDCRWYTLKAMDYIGGPEARTLVKDRGAKDKDGAPKRLAERILAGS